MKIFLISMCLYLFASYAHGETPVRSGLKHEQLSFHFQELLDPYGSYPCKHAEDGMYDWLVYCKVERKVLHFAVHLAVSRYGKTQYGRSAYEVLYWVTDRSNGQSRTYDSTTLWIHQDNEVSRATVFELSQGIQNDLAALRLKIDM